MLNTTNNLSNVPNSPGTYESKGNESEKIQVNSKGAWGQASLHAGSEQSRQPDLRADGGGT
jgi:hypothetical protein